VLYRQDQTRNQERRREGEAPWHIFHPTWKNVLDIVQNYWT